MHRPQWLSGVAFTLLLTGVSGAGEAWSLPGWAYRRPVVLSDTPSGAAAAFARFAHLGLIAEDARNLRLTDGEGNLLDFELLRLGPGDAAEILFPVQDVRPGQVFFIYFGNSGAHAPTSKAWTAEAGVVLEVRSKGEGHADTWEQYQQLWKSSTTVQGRILRGAVFDGYNPLGPSEQFLSKYRAFFNAPADGEYGFATNSDDASFLFVDGRKVSEYPGWHGAERRIGEGHGVVRLTKGAHKLEYWHAQGGGGTATIAAWRKPGEKYFALMPPEAFVPLARGQALALERSDGRPTLDFQWWPADQLVVNGQLLVRMNFECRAPFEGQIAWLFGDGAHAVLKKEGEAALGRHLFLSPGTYKVEIKAEDSTWTPITQSVVVEPVWQQREEWHDKLWGEYRPQALKRLADGTVKPLEVRPLLAYAVELEDAELLKAVGAIAWKLEAQLPEADRANIFYGLGRALQGPARDYGGAERALRAAAAGPGDAAFLARVKLHLAGLLIHVAGRPAEALPLLAQIGEQDLTQAHEPVLKRIYGADALAGLGRREDAHAAYEALRAAPLTDRAYAARRRGRLVSAGSYLRAGDFEAALQILDEIEWETPLERAADETGLLRAECLLGMKDYPRAAVLLERLRAMNPASGQQPEMLYKLIHAYLGLAQKERAQACYATLKKSFPYAAETALAKRQLEP